MATSKRSSGFNYKFIDQATSSKYACTLCYSVPKEPLKAQCCGATYCQSCAAGHTEYAESSASASQSTADPLLSQNIKVCFNCESEELQLLPDSSLEENIAKLRVECPVAGCGWVGELTEVEAHMTEPHDDLEDELYANDFADQPETTRSQQSWAQQYRKAHTPSIRSPQPPPSRYQGTPMPTTTDEWQETLPVTPQPLSTRQQLQIEQELPSPTKRNQLCGKYLSCCRSQGFADLSTSEKLLYIASFLTTILWFLLVIPTSVIVLLSSINKVRNESASFAPSCDYSVALLWLVILVHIIVAVCSMVWFGRCCKPCKKKRMSRAALSILCVIALLYAMVVIGFAVSVFPFVNQSSDSDSQSDTGDTMGPQSSGSGSGSGVSASGSGDNVASAEGVSGEGGSGEGGSGEGGCGEGGSGEIGSGGSGSGGGDIGLENGSICDKSMNETNNRTLDNEIAEETICIEISSEPFILALVFLGLLCVFVVAMLCIVSYECSRNGFCYRKTQYDPTVTVIENESSVIA